MERSDPEYYVLSFSATKWDGHWGITHKMVSELSQDHKVVYVTPRKEIRIIVKEIFQKLPRERSIRKINRNFLLIESPPFFPKIYRYPNIDLFIEKIYHYFISLICFIFAPRMKRLVYIWEPEYSFFINWYKKDCTLFHAYDNYSLYTYTSESGQNKDQTHESSIRTEHKKNEENLIRNVSLFYAVSEELCNYYEENYNRRPKLLPNAVENDYFLEKIDESLKEDGRKLIEAIPGYKIGYSGSIKGVLDIDIIIDSAKELKEFSFVFFGKAIYTNIKEYDDKLRNLISLKNVYYLGNQDRKILPYLLAEMDLLLMVYSNRKDVWTYYSDPAKLFEYMAIGKPIISTPQPVINKYGRYINIVNNADDFIKTARDICTSQCKTVAREMKDVAGKNMWKHRVAVVEDDFKDLNWRWMQPNGRQGPGEAIQ